VIAQANANLSRALHKMDAAGYTPVAVHKDAVYRKRQDSERKRAVARVSLRWPLPAGAYAACSTAHTAPHRSWNRRR